MSTPSLYRSSPRQARRFLGTVLGAGLVPFIKSSPGMGKSQITHSIGQQANLKLIDHRLSTSAPEDLSGLPRFNEKGEAVFAPFAELFPLEGTALPKDEHGKDMAGWLLFLDEFTSASKEVQAAAYKLILDRMVGQRKLHPQVFIVAAGNLATDRAIVNRLGTAMQSRLIHVEMEINFIEWLEDVALPQSYDPRIIAFLSAYPDKLMEFHPDSDEVTFSCPRTWEFMNKLIEDVPVLQMEDAPLYRGTITSGTAVEFVAFTEAFQGMVSIDEILKDPANCALPKSDNAMWATITMMVGHISKTTFAALMKYADRFPMDRRILFFRSAMVKHPELRREQAFINSLSALSKYLND